MKRFVTAVLFALCAAMMAQAAVEATASHILVKTEKEATDLLAQLEAGADFGALAKQYSTCPSGRNGGSLGSFGRGRMVPEFDEAVFTGEVGKPIGPVKTQFGYHLIFVEERTDMAAHDRNDV